MREFTVADWLVRPDVNRIARGGVEEHLEPRVMDLLVYLAERPGEVLGKEQILRDVWPEAYVSDDALLTAISLLRKAFGDDPRRPNVIETIPRRGYRLVARSSARAAAVLAVLPLQNLSDSTEEAFFADGMTEALIAELGKVPALRVISRRSSMSYRDGDKSLPEIAAELGAGLIVEGSVLRSGDRVRISAELIDAAEDCHLWAQTYERDLEDVLRLQREMADTIARALSDSLRAAPSAAPPAPAAHPEALIAYLRGRFHWWKFSPEHFDRALEYFQEALRLDPDFAAAHAGISDVWGAYGYWGVRHPADVRDKVFQAARRAEDLDPLSAEAQMLLGAYFFYYPHDWLNAERRFRRAIELNPNLAHARVFHALFLTTMNRMEAEDEIELAVRLDPLNPGALLVHAMWLGARGCAGEAWRAMERLLEIDPDHRPGLQLRADLAWLQGREDAIEAERAAWVGDDELQTALGRSPSGAAPRQALRAAANLLETRRADSSCYVQPLQIARLLVHAGEIETALQWLERAAASDELMQIDLLRLNPAWNPLRGRPRFEALIARLGLPS